MFSHVFIGTNDFERTFRLYAALMETLGNPLRFCDRERPWAGWQSDPGPRPLLLVGAPYDGNPHAAGNGQMVALTAADRATVDLAYQTALDHGAMPEGAPGLRPEYHAHYYAAYFRDTEGNKICVVCHDPAPAVEPQS